jgi:hypothetical protein
MIIAMVLRSGGDFVADDVAILRKQLEQAWPQTRIVCLSDVDVDCERIPLKHDWPRWWPKIELFDAERLPPPWLYFDLDTIVRGPIDVPPHDLVMLPNPGYPGRHMSGLMALNVPMPKIYERFLRGPRKFQSTHKFNSGLFGDQGFIEISATSRPMPWPVGKDIVHYKLSRGQIPEQAKVIVFQGKPRPRDINWTV